MGGATGSVPTGGRLEIRTTEMHTGGEPVRIVTSGYPNITGDTILAKRRYAREHLDHLRRLLMHEPRGHIDMYGVIPVEPDLPLADMAVLFMHNEGYSTMCGHAVIALGRWAVDARLVSLEEPETTINIQCPCGLVPTHVAVENGRAGAVRFESVPAFVAASDIVVDVPGHGNVAVDVAYGGAFYAVAPANRFGLDVRASPIRELVDAATAVTEVVRTAVPIDHPDGPDLAFLYGTVLTDGEDDDAAQPTANICVFADGQVDRSPTGSGVTARIALQLRRKQIGIGRVRRFESVTGAVFTGRPLRETKVGDFPAVIVEVGGVAHYTGEGRFTVEADDPLPGFLLR